MATSKPGVEPGELKPARAQAQRAKSAGRDFQEQANNGGRVNPLFRMLTRESSVAEGSLLFMAAFLCSAALGVVRQLLFNAQFGTGPEASAYYAAFRLPDTLANLIAGGALSSAMIPVLLTTGREDGPEAKQRLVNLVLTTLLVVVTLVAGVGLAFAPWFVGTILAPGFDQATSELAVTLTRIMLLQAPIVVLSSVAIAVLNSRNRFALTALSIVAHNLTLIGGILAAAWIPGVGIYGPTLGVIGDAVLQTLILLPGVRHARVRFRPAWGFFDRRLREVVRLLVPNGLSVTVNYAGTIIDTAFATLTREAAALPALHNAFLLIGVPIRLTGVAIGQAAFPRFAAYADIRDWRRLRRALLRTLAVVLLVAVPLAAGLMLFGRPLVRFLFERGRFEAFAGDLTYQLLVAYAVALPAYIATEVLTRGLIALWDTRTPLLTNCLQLGGRAMIIALTLDRWGAVAIPIAFAITSSLEALALGAVLWWKIRRRVVM